MGSLASGASLLAVKRRAISEVVKLLTQPQWFLGEHEAPSEGQSNNARKQLSVRLHRSPSAPNRTAASAILIEPVESHLASIALAENKEYTYTHTFKSESLCVSKGSPTTSGSPLHPGAASIPNVRLENGFSRLQVLHLRHYECPPLDSWPPSSSGVPTASQCTLEQGPVLPVRRYSGIRWSWSGARMVVSMSGFALSRFCFCRLFRCW